MSDARSAARQLPFAPEPIREPSLIQRLTRREPAHNHFARAKNLALTGELSVPKIATIEAAYGRDLCSDFEAEWLALLEEAVVYFARDGIVDAAENTWLRDFIKCFRIARPKAESATKRGGHRAVAEFALSLIEDGAISDEERKRIEKLAKYLGLDAQQSDQELAAALQRHVESELESLLADDMISDSEWDLFVRLRGRLGVAASISPETRERIDLARQRWRVLYAELPVCERPGVNLYMGEVAHARCRAEWYENRKVRGGGSSWDQLTLILTGDLLLTDRRLLLLADRGDNKSIRWPTVLDVDVVDVDRIKVNKARGKSPTLELSDAEFGALEHVPLIARRLLRDFG